VGKQLNKMLIRYNTVFLSCHLGKRKALKEPGINIPFYLGKRFNQPDYGKKIKPKKYF